MKSEALELYNKLSPEFKLLCKCATAKPVTQAAQTAIIALINWPVAWPRFLELVKYHQVYPWFTGPLPKCRRSLSRWS